MNIKDIKCVVPHCGSAHVKGKARNYPYYVCSLFYLHKCKDGHLVWKNSGVSTHPRRSLNKCLDDGKELANKKNVIFNGKYGSLHNQTLK